MLLEHRSKNKGTLIVIVLLVLLAGIVLLAWKNRGLQTQSELTTPPLNEETLPTFSFPNEYLGEAIENYLLTQKDFSWKNEEDNVNVCIVENLEPGNQLFPFSVWAYCAEYKLDNGELKIVSGSSLPAKINYPNELSFYDLDKFSHEVPRDGSHNSEDIKTIFSTEAQQTMSNLDKQILIKKAEAIASLKLQEKTTN